MSDKAQPEDRRVSIIIEEEPSFDFQKDEKLPLFENTDLKPDEIREFFRAVENGSIQDLDDLFHTKTNADPNMTEFTESLLMAAIRHSRKEVAEYLVERWTINVNQCADITEFRMKSKAPFRYRSLTCRELAYQKGMMDLVDMIDIASNHLKTGSQQLIKRRLETRLDQIHQSYIQKPKLRKQNSSAEMSDDSAVSSDDEQIPRSTTAPVLAHRPFQSRIEIMMKNIPKEQTSDFSIDKTGKKTFRYSGYKLRFRLLDTTNNAPQSTSTSTQHHLNLPAQTSSRSKVPKSISKIHTSVHPPVRETRTSMSRSNATLRMLCKQN